MKRDFFHLGFVSGAMKDIAVWSCRHLQMCHLYPHSQHFWHLGVVRSPLISVSVIDLVCVPALE